jgi:diguanylate cyclase (GGDEF)-like protein
MLARPVVALSPPGLVTLLAACSSSERTSATGSCPTSRRTARVVVASAIVLLVAVPDIRANDPAPATTTPLRLQLKWRHQFQFAGFYTALEKGYYREAGLDVAIIALAPGSDPVDIVLSGEAEFGVASSELVLRYAKGDPVVVLVTIFQHSPLALFVRSDVGIDSPQQLAGRKVALAPWETEIFAYLQREHVPVNQVQILEHDHSVDSLLKGRVDALAGYETDESYYLQRSGRQFRQFTPRSSGVDFYGDTLFTTRAMVNEHPEWAEAFVAASLRGWEYALGHQEEIAALIHAKYAPDLPVEKLRFEAASMLPLVRTDLVELGHTHVARWQHIFDVYRALGLAPAANGIDLSGLIYRRAQPTDWQWLLWVLAAAALSLAVLTWVARRFYRISADLREQLEENRRLGEELRALTITDPLTGLRNRRHFDTACAAEWDRARRAHKPLTVLFIDIDFFKAYNDNHGHGAGDECIAAVAKAVDQSLQRPADLAARYGGDEFVVLLPDTDLNGALDVAGRVAAAVRGLNIPHGSSPFGRVTLSIGAAQQVPEPNHSPQEMLQRADRALYSAKEAGRNEIMPAPTYIFDHRAVQ